MILGIIISTPFMALLWFVIFKFLLKLDKKNAIKNIAEKIEKQDKIFRNNGKQTNLKEKLMEIPKPKQAVKKKEKKSFLSIFKRKNKKLGTEEVKEEIGEEEPEETITDTEETPGEEEVKKEVGENAPGS